MTPHMMATFVLYCPPLWALLLEVALVYQLVVGIDIRVDEERGISNSSCCSSSSVSPCRSLALALECVQNISLATPVSLIVNEGDYILTNDATLTVIEQRTGGFSITGNCLTTDPCVVIECEKGAGLSFFKSSAIKLENVLLTGCGFPNNSTSKDFSQAKQPTVPGGQKCTLFPSLPDGHHLQCHSTRD